MEILPQEIYRESQAQYQCVTRLKFLLSALFFCAMPCLSDHLILSINMGVAAINCLLIMGLMEMEPRMLRDSLQEDDQKYALPQTILDYTSFVLLVWLFISTAITMGFF